MIILFRTRLAAFASGILTFLFAIAMVLALGVKAPLNYSVFAFCGIVPSSNYRCISLERG